MARTPNKAQWTEQHNNANTFNIEHLTKLDDSRWIAASEKSIYEFDARKDEDWTKLMDHDENESVLFLSSTPNEILIAESCGELKAIDLNEKSIKTLDKDFKNFAYSTNSSFAISGRFIHSIGGRGDCQNKHEWYNLETQTTKEADIDTKSGYQCIKAGVIAEKRRWDKNIK